MEDLEPIIEGCHEQIPVIAGPCSAESRQQVLETAKACAAMGVDVYRAGVWKPRTRPGGFEGIGEAALSWLHEASEVTGLPVATEVATPHHVEAALKAGIDMLWIGARTAANPFAMQEVADALRGAEIAVLVKNPVCPDLELWIGSLQRIHNAGIRKLGAIHRGFSAYDATPYRNRPMWQIPTALKIAIPALPVFVDPSHIGGDRSLIAPLSQRALDLGFDGLMIETHPNPCEALSDARQQLTPSDLKQLLSSLRPRRGNAIEADLAALRAEIDEIDSEIIHSLAHRMEVARKIGTIKQASGMAVIQPERYNDVIASRVAEAGRLGINPAMMRRILLDIHDESVRQQLDLQSHDCD